MQNAIAVISLAIAALAVFVGPYLALRTVRLQLAVESRRIWGDQLREKLALFFAKTRHYFTSGFEVRIDAEYLELAALHSELTLLLDSQNPEQVELCSRLNSIVNALEAGNREAGVFIEAHTEASRLAAAMARKTWLAHGE